MNLSLGGKFASYKSQPLFWKLCECFFLSVLKKNDKTHQPCKKGKEKNLSEDY